MRGSIIISLKSGKGFDVLTQIRTYFTCLVP